jgi:hypothetical protein
MSAEEKAAGCHPGSHRGESCVVVGMPVASPKWDAFNGTSTGHW